MIDPRERMIERLVQERNDALQELVELQNQQRLIQEEAVLRHKQNIQESCWTYNPLKDEYNGEDKERTTGADTGTPVSESEDADPDS